MKVGICAGIRVHRKHPQPLREVYNNFLDQGVLAEELGYDRMWLSEHHFADDLWNPSPIVVLGALAVRTKRIRLGTYVLLLPLHNPIRVAEDACTVDIISNGRFDLAFGGTAMEAECETLGIDKSESFSRSYEALSIIDKCMTEEEFSFHGKHFNFPNVRMTTKPVQKPRIPMYMAALQPQSLERAAKRGYNLASAFHTPIWGKYGEMQQKLGRKRDSYEIVSGPLYAHVAETREKAWDQAEEAMHEATDFYNRRGHQMPLPPVGRLRHESEKLAYGLPAAVGTPDDVLKVLSRYSKEDVDEMVPYLYFPGMKFDDVKNSMRLFAKEIMPEIRRWGRKPGN